MAVGEKGRTHEEGKQKRTAVFLKYFSTVEFNAS